jgi:predicted GIY-YIG superfamily endonuclease
MPKTPIDYSKTIIYKLVHNEDYDNANIYIGSTTDFIKRKNHHKNNCNSEKSKDYNVKKYQYIRDNGGWNEWNMIEIEKYPECNDGNEARAKEEYWKCHFNSQLNSRRAYITDEERKEQKKEYHENNKDKILKQQKERYEQNKGKILEKITCECGCILANYYLTRHRKTQRHLLLTNQIKYEFVDDN